MKCERIKSVLCILLCSIVAMLAMPNMLSAKTYSSSKTNSEISTEEHYWQKRLNRLINKEITKGLKLVKYKVVGKVTTENQKQKFIDKCLDERAYVMYDDDNYQKTFKIATIGEIKNNNPNIYEDFKRHLELRTDRMQPNDTEIVCLTWEYNGKQFKSYAAVTDTFRKYSSGKTYPEAECVIFDNMLMPINIINCSTSTIAYEII